MSVVEMHSNNITQGNSFEYTENLLSAMDSNIILIPSIVQNVSVEAEATGGATATVYETTDSILTVRTGIGITWIAWAHGAVTTAKSSSLYPPTAIKLTQTGAGASKISIRCQ
jgi:hypothetical protein